MLGGRERCSCVMKLGEVFLCLDGTLSMSMGANLGLPKWKTSGKDSLREHFRAGRGASRL